MTWRLEKINEAIMRVGGEPFITEEDVSFDVALRIYKSVLANLFAHPWTFIKRTRRLTRLASSPVQHYAYAFEMPAEREGTPRAFWEDPALKKVTMEFEIEGDLVLCNAETLYGKFMIIDDGQRWPGDFHELLNKALMAEYALTFREDRPMRNELYQECFGTPSEGGCGGLLAKCLTADNQSEPATVVGGGYNPLIDVR